MLVQGLVFVLGDCVAAGLDVECGVGLGLGLLVGFGRGHYPDPPSVGECPCFPGPHGGGRWVWHWVDGGRTPELLEFHGEVEEAGFPAAHFCDLVIEVPN